MLNEYEREHGGTAVYGINRFSDLTPEEFKGQCLLTNVHSYPMVLVLIIATHLSPVRKLPQRHESKFEGRKTFQGDRLDWREKGVIGSIRDQKQVASYNKIAGDNINLLSPSTIFPSSSSSVEAAGELM